MKRHLKKRLYLILSFILCLTVVDPISATTISDLKEDVKKNQSQLKNAQQKISDAQDAQEGVEEEIDEMDQELVSLLTDIDTRRNTLQDGCFCSPYGAFTASVEIIGFKIEHSN